MDLKLLARKANGFTPAKAADMVKKDVGQGSGAAAYAGFVVKKHAAAADEAAVAEE